MFSNEFETALRRLKDRIPDCEKWRIVHEYFSGLGLPVVNYSFIEGHGDQLGEAPVRMQSTADPEFIAEYMARRLDLVDPLADHGRSGDPRPYIVSSTIEETVRPLSQDRRRHLDFVDAASHNASLLVPLPSGPGMPAASGVVLGGKLDRSLFENLLNSRGSELLVFAHHMHAHLSGYALRKAEGLDQLSDRERDCLTYIASGLRPDRIAEKMGIATVTVNFHLANARAALTARTTAEAVAKALRYGMIDP